MGGTVKKRTKVTRAIPRAFLSTFFLSTRCFEYSAEVMMKAIAAANGEKTRARKKTSFNTDFPASGNQSFAFSVRFDQIL